MASDKNNLAGNTAMLVLNLLAEHDRYGYQIIEELSRRSENVFQLKTGTLYPILHGLERDGFVTSYDGDAAGARVRKYYRVTGKGRDALRRKQSEWAVYTRAVTRVLEGGSQYATV
jgi:PadR family transcriptional regulator PadR